MHTIHLYLINLARINVLWAKTLLSPAEQARADRLLNPVLGIRFMQSRAAIKTILGQWLGTAPQTICFSTTELGKPDLPKLAFSISTSRTTSLLALCTSKTLNLGCDIEYLDQDMEYALTSAFFHHQEQQALTALAPTAQLQAFYTLWVRKEAIMKASGLGLHAGLDHVLVDLEPIHAEGTLLTNNELSLWHCPVFFVHNYALALAWQKKICARISWHKFPFTS